VLRSRVLHVALGAFSAGLLVLVFLAALIGEPSSATNLAPTFVLVIFWLGLVPVVVGVNVPVQQLRDDFDAIVRSFHLMIDHLQMQAEKGVKFMPGDTDISYRAPIQYYINELILGNNNMILTLDNKQTTMITYSVFQYLFTKDIRFTKKVSDSFDGLLNRSTLISKAGEKDRNKFFNALREKVNGLKR